MPTSSSPRTDATPAFAAQLETLRQLVTPWLQAATTGGEPRRYLYDLIAQQLSRAGKGLRPALCIATCRAFGGDVESVLPVAAALEMMHNAFLVHDDIEDGSELRRDQPTLHVAHGIPLAINVGDAMQAMSIRLVRRSVDRLGPVHAWRLYDELEHMLMESLEGQALEIGWVRDNECGTTADDYLLMTLKKTCWYSFIHPCRLGALVANADDQRLDRFDRFGYFLGVAFQIQDDVLNLMGDERKYGKEIGGDLWEGKRSLILVDMLSKASPLEIERVRQILGKPRSQRLARDIAWLDEQIERYGSLGYARVVARQFAEAAARELPAALQGARQGPDAQFLKDVVDFVVQRDL